MYLSKQAQLYFSFRTMPFSTLCIVSPVPNAYRKPCYCGLHGIWGKVLLHHHSPKILTNFPSKDVNINAQKCNIIISVNIPIRIKLFGNGANEKNVKCYITYWKHFLLSFIKKKTVFQLWSIEFVLDFYNNVQMGRKSSLPIFGVWSYDTGHCGTGEKTWSRTWETCLVTALLLTSWVVWIRHLTPLNLKSQILKMRKLDFTKASPRSKISHYSQRSVHFKQELTSAYYLKALY